MPARVLWLIKGFGLGGAERLLAVSAPHLDRDRFRYRAAYLMPSKDALVGEIVHAGIETTCLSFTHVLDVRIISRIAAFLQQQRIDLVHLHLPYTGIVGRLAAWLAAIPCVVYTEHNVQDCYHPVSRILNQATMGLCDLTIAVSAEVQASLLRSPLTRRARVKVIPNGVDVEGLRNAAAQGRDVAEEFAIPPGHLVVGMAGMFRHEKGLDVWMHAARLIAAGEPRSVFLLVGDGPERNRLQAMAKDLGLRDRIIFAGLRSDAPRLIASFDVFMLSSIHEGLPVSVLEAMALARPVVATRVGGVPGVLEDGRHGFLVPPQDPAALADRVLACLRNPAFRHKAGEAASRRVQERFSIKQMVHSVEQVYAQVLNEHNGIRMQ